MKIAYLKNINIYFVSSSFICKYLFIDSLLLFRRSTPSKTGKNEIVKREGPKWDPDRLKLETTFVMGARANKLVHLVKVSNVISHT